MEHPRIGEEFSVPPDQVIVLLRSIPLLLKLPPATLKRVSEVVQTLRFGPGEPIVQLNCEGAGLYIIWKGEAKVVSPPSGYPYGHKESRLRCGDYFGTATTESLKQKYKVEVVAITEVVSLILAHEHAELLAASSVWDSGEGYAEGLSKIERILRLETIEVDLYRTIMPVPHRTVTGNYYGGQFIGQALLAATKSVNQALLVHSFHCYFIRTGDENVPVVYQVERTREGTTFSTRHVRALQKGNVVFTLYASFKREEESLEHSVLMPVAPKPEEVEPFEQRYEQFLTDPRLPMAAKKKYGGVKLPLPPIEMRYVDPPDRFRPVKLEPRQQVWMRSRAKLPEEQSVHRCVGAYATDMCLLETSLRPFPEIVGMRMQVLSLDHMVWFHQSFRADEWLLYVCESTIVKDARGLNFGRIFSQDGKLVMTVAQEGVLRRVEDKAEKVAKL